MDLRNITGQHLAEMTAEEILEHVEKGDFSGQDLLDLHMYHASSDSRGTLKTRKDWLYQFSGMAMQAIITERGGSFSNVGVDHAVRWARELLNKLEAAHIRET